MRDLIFCAEADCSGENKDKGIYCPCRKSHYSELEVLRWWVTYNELGKMIDGVFHIWDGVEYLKWREYEDLIKQEIKNPLEG